MRRLADIVRERDIWVVAMQDPPEGVKNLVMEVGIENALHIDFEVQKTHYDLRDVILGKVYFKLVRVRVKHAEVAIVRRETTGYDPITFSLLSYLSSLFLSTSFPLFADSGLSIDFEVQKTHYDLRDVILGKVYFKLVRVRVKHAEVAIVRRETTGFDPTTFSLLSYLSPLYVFASFPLFVDSGPFVDFEVQKTHYDLRDVILGKVYFKLVRARVKHAEVAIVRRETTGYGTSALSLSPVHLSLRFPSTLGPYFPVSS